VNDPAIRFFVDILKFELLEDSPAVTTDGRPKRWVVVRLPGAQTGCSWPAPILNAKARSLETSTPADVGFSCASTTLLLTTSEWSEQASSS
jgi:hypothetical protein